jgi:flagellar L-ring protein precursor FlgH
MKKTITPNLGLGGVGLAALMLGGCAGLNEAVAPPQLTAIQNPATLAGSQRVSMPLPMPIAETAAPNSLWRTGARSFFNDQRAAKIGDILTVNIEIADSAQLKNTSARSRTSSTDTSLNAALGLEDIITKTLPGTPSLSPGVDFGSTSASNGTGSVNRQETVNLTVAAVITDILPNGNMVIGGSQEVKINNELRELLVSGVIRPEDVAADNTIAHSKIAEARISYGGRGDISNVQRDRYGKLIYDQVTPF